MASQSGLTDYEQERAKKIARNNARLAELNLPTLAETVDKRPSKERAPKKPKTSASEGPARRSKRDAAAETKRRIASSARANDDDDNDESGQADSDASGSLDTGGESGSDSESVEDEGDEEGQDEERADAARQFLNPVEPKERSEAQRARCEAFLSREGANAAKVKQPRKSGPKSEAKEDLLASIDVAEVFSLISGGRSRLTFDDLKRAEGANGFAWSDEQIRDMLLDLTGAEGIFDDGTPAEDLSIGVEEFEELYGALLASRRGAGARSRK